jgi:hypothetical protein
MWTFLQVVVSVLIGFALVSSMGDEIKNPEKQIPRAFFTPAPHRVPLRVRHGRNPALALAA